MSFFLQPSSLSISIFHFPFRKPGKMPAATLRAGTDRDGGRGRRTGYMAPGTPGTRPARSCCVDDAVQFQEELQFILKEKK